MANMTRYGDRGKSRDRSRRHNGEKRRASQEAPLAPKITDILKEAKNQLKK